MGIGDDRFRDLFQQNSKLKLFVVSGGNGGVSPIESTGGGIRVRFVQYSQDTFQLSLPAPAAPTRTDATSPALDTEKIDVIEVRTALANVAESKQAALNLQTIVGPRQAALQSLQKQIEDIRQRLNGGTSLNDAEKGTLTTESQQLTQRFTQQRKDSAAEFAQAQTDAINRLVKKMNEIIVRYASEHDLNAIVNIDPPQNQLWYAGPNSGWNSTNFSTIATSNRPDITQDIVKLYDKAHPLTGTNPNP